MNGSAINRFRKLVGVVAGASAALSAANADVSDVVLHVEAASASGAGQVSFGLEGGSWNAATKTYTWGQATPLSVVDANSGAVVATLRSATVTLKKCSEISVTFSVDAGASLTEFVVRSPALSFATIAAASSQAKTSARLDVADLNLDGAAMSGAGTPGTGAFHARYNGAFESVAEFTHLVALVSCGAGGSGYGQQNDPPSGYRAMSADVSDMSTYFHFTLTPGDRCTATTRFDVNPDPSNCPEDADGDSLPDWLDGCPNDPAKTAPGACGCGNVDSDGDGDGIADCNDNCPDVANASQADADNDGIGDGCDSASPDDPPGGDGSDDQGSDDDGEDDSDDNDGSNSDNNGDNNDGAGGDNDSADGDGSNPSGDGSNDDGASPADKDPQSSDEAGNNPNSVVAGVTHENSSGDAIGGPQDAVELVEQAVSRSTGCGAGGLGLASLGAMGALGLRRKR